MALLDEWWEGREYGCFEWKTFIYHTHDFCHQPRMSTGIRSSFAGTEQGFLNSNRLANLLVFNTSDPQTFPTTDLSSSFLCNIWWQCFPHGGQAMPRLAEASPLLLLFFSFLDYYQIIGATTMLIRKSPLAHMHDPAIEKLKQIVSGPLQPCRVLFPFLGHLV